MFNVFIFDKTTGTIIPDAAQIQAYVINVFKSILGNNLNTDPSTPQGSLIQAFTIMFIGLAENNASLANQINRNIAGGIFLDADAALFGIQRKSGNPSTVYATLSGVAGTVIPANSQASESTNGAVFATVESVTIPAEGSIANVQFQSWSNQINPPGFINGPIPCAAETLTQIVSNVIGWETVTNPDAAIQGTLQQSDVNFNYTINNSLARQSIGALGSITARIYTTEGVKSAYPLENVEEITTTIQGVSMVAKSIYYCIDYTCSNEDIASAFTHSKDPGPNYNWGPGINQSYLFVAPISSQEILIKWDSPSIIYIQIQVTISKLTSLQDPDTTIKSAVLKYADGEVPLMPGFVVGANVSPSNISAGIAQQVPGISIQKVEVGVLAFTKQGTLENGTPDVTDMPSTSRITDGMSVSGDGIPGGTTVSGPPTSDSLTLSANATLSGVEILKFTQSVSYQTTPLSIAAWEKAATLASYITVIEV